MMMTGYYYSSNSGCLLSTYCVLGILLMILLFIFFEDPLYAWPGLFQAQEIKQ